VNLTATQAIKRVRGGQSSAVELVRAALESIAARDKELHAWVHVDPQLALNNAALVDEKLRAGTPVGALCGVPVGVKDIFNTRDMPTQMGSPIWKGFTPGNDARVVHYLRMADGVIPGKTVTAEFAVHAPGPTVNPHNPAYGPGTSSSGSAAAVAAGMVPLALGTQTAGSTIRPASYCGVYGFKPTFGLIARTGMLKTTDSLDTVGLFARSPDDLALLFDVVRVHGTDYPISHALLNDPARQQKGERPWRVAVVRGPKWRDAERYAQKAFDDFVARLAKRGGVRVEEREIAELEKAHEIHATIYDRTLAYYFREEFKQHTLISGVIYEIIERGNRISLDAYKAALERQAELTRHLDDVFAAGPDVILNLSTGGEALRGLDAVDRPDNCLIWTLCGAPTINVPAFRGPNGLPFGLQVVGRRYSDYLALGFARWLEDEGVLS
jgi:Asp-tRNA(Asn)/Glu-tRNA(Gln) amidotransferase A subunit family amidase